MSFYSLHVEVPVARGLAVEAGAGDWPTGTYGALHGDIGLVKRVWSSGRSAIVLNLSFCVDGVIDPVHDNYYPDAPHYLWGLGVAGGAFYEYRDGVLLRAGLIPQWWFYTETNGFPNGYLFGGAKYLGVLALQTGWSF
jgi:hypothetical protein